MEFANIKAVKCNKSKIITSLFHIVKMMKYKFAINKPINEYKLTILSKKPYKKNDNKNLSIINKNLITLKKNLQLNNNIENNINELTKTLVNLISNNINDYYIVITADETNAENKFNPDIMNFETDEYLSRTYFNFCLLKLANLAYNNNFTFKIYFAVISKKKNLSDVINKKSIEEYPSIEIGTKKQKEYYDDRIHLFSVENNIDTSSFIYFIIMSMLGISNKTLVKNNINNAVFNSIYGM